MMLMFQLRELKDDGYMIEMKGTKNNNKRVWPSYIYILYSIYKYPTRVYPLINLHSNGIFPCSIGNTSSNGPCSIAMLVYTKHLHVLFYKFWSCLSSTNILRSSPCNTFFEWIASLWLCSKQGKLAQEFIVKHPNTLVFWGIFCVLKKKLFLNKKHTKQSVYSVYPPGK